MMRVTIEQVAHTVQVQTGWFSKQPRTKYAVKLRVELTGEERAVLDQHKLWKHIVCRVPFNWETNNPHHARLAAKDPRLLGPLPTHREYSITQFVDGCTFDFDTLIEARNFEVELRDTHLPLLKSFITGNTGSTSKTTTFEL